MSWALRKGLLFLMLGLFFLSFSKTLFSQELSPTKGGLTGVVTDKTGAIIPGAAVTASGSSDTRTVTTDDTGRFTISSLTPGLYTVTVKKEGFKVAEAKNLEVVINRNSGVSLSMEPGEVAQTVEVDASTAQVDTTSTALGDNLTATFYNQVPVARNVGSLFYTAPGAVNGGGTGTSNPSIGGATGLENQYVADGVGIGDAGYGGLGVFSPIYGSLGTGINLSFIQEVQVKTGAFEPKYGKANGGLVQIVTKSGGSQYHGALSAYFAPEQFEATNYYADNFGRQNIHGHYYAKPEFDASVELGGYIPVQGKHDKLFFFGAFNPSLNQISWISPPISPLVSHGSFTNSTTAYSWAGKLTYKPSDNVTFEASAYGDPSSTNFGLGLANEDTFPFYPNLNQGSTSAFSRWDYGTRSEVVRMNTTLSPTWQLTLSATAKQSHFTEGGYQNIYDIADYTGTVNPALGFNAQGIPGAYIQNPENHSYGFNIDTQKTVNFHGQHTFSVGWGFDRSIYDLSKDYTGPHFAFPGTNSAGLSITTPASAGGANAKGYLVGADVSAGFNLLPISPGDTCAPSRCPFYHGQQVYLQQVRGLITPAGSPLAHLYHSGSGYHAIYGNDDWSINRHVTINAGIRWEEEQLNGVIQQYVFTDNWSPRLGINIDPFGDRKTKIFFNFGRYTQALPTDAAIRELNQEIDFYRANWAPASDGNGNAVIGPTGTVVPVMDAAHLISGDPAAGLEGIPASTANPGGTGTISASGSSPELIASNTRMNYEEEYVAGIERQIKGFAVSARYTDRRLLRIVEDMSGASPEGALSGYVPQNFLIGNPSSTADYFVNEVETPYATTAPANCPEDYGIQNNSLGVAVGGACGSNPADVGATTPDGKPDGFANPRRHYQALEIEANKNFSHNFLLRANYRWAKLYGNYEGLFRNDNGQSDPGVSSLFDFTQGALGLLGNQFQPGFLNTDRRNVGNLYGSYLIPRGYFKKLTVGAGLRGQSGTPISRLAAHPVYQDPGEVPIGGRGIFGRTPSNLQLDLHTDYPISISDKAKLKLAWDMFNVTDSRFTTYKTQNQDLTFGVPNADFLKPESFQRSFYARGSVRLEF